MVDSGVPSEGLGPRYRVTVLNDGNANINQEFTVKLSPTNDSVAAANLPGSIKRVSGLNGGDATTVDVRLPLGTSAQNLGDLGGWRTRNLDRRYRQQHGSYGPRFDPGHQPLIAGIRKSANEKALPANPGGFFRFAAVMPTLPRSAKTPLVNRWSAARQAVLALLRFRLPIPAVAASGAMRAREDGGGTWAHRLGLAVEPSAVSRNSRPNNMAFAPATSTSVPTANITPQRR